MRFIFKSIVVVLLVAGIGNYLIYLKTGQMPIRDLRERWGSDWWVDMKEKYAPDELAKQAKKTVNGLTQDEAANTPPTKVYKWTDANGQVHYGDKPDTAGAEQVEVKVHNTLSEQGQDAAEGEQNSISSALQTPLEKARAAAESMQTRTLPKEAN